MDWIAAMEVAIKAPTAVLCYLSVLGIFGNSNIVWATYRKKSLRSTCNIFIGINALADVLHQSGNLALGYTVFSGNFITPMELCFKLQVVPTFGCTVSSVMLFMTAVDRMICVVFPKQYELSCKSIILPIGIIISLCIASFFTVISYVHMDEGIRICGALMDMPYTLAPYYFLQSVFFLFSTILLYVIIWIAVRTRNYKKSKQMLKSITAISLCICGGWLMTMGMGVIFNKFQISDSYATALYAGTLINTSISLNYPLLYNMSREYNIAFKEQIRILTCDVISINTKATESQVIAYSGRSTRL